MQQCKKKLNFAFFSRALFPCGDHMVVIIDDREDVWNFAPNLIHVRPYHFFQHTGDINAPPGLSKRNLMIRKDLIFLPSMLIKQKRTSRLRRKNPNRPIPRSPMARTMKKSVKYLKQLIKKKKRKKPVKYLKQLLKKKKQKPINHQSNAMVNRQLIKMMKVKRKRLLRIRRQRKWRRKWRRKWK